MNFAGRDLEVLNSGDRALRSLSGDSGRSATFHVLPADVLLAYLDKRIPELEEEGREPFHPKHCGPCAWCQDRSGRFPEIAYLIEKEWLS